MSLKENELILEELEAQFTAAIDERDWKLATDINKKVYDMGFHKEYAQLAEAKNEAMIEDVTKFGDDPRYAAGEIMHA